MQSVHTLEMQIQSERPGPTYSLNDAARRVVQRLFGCWQHDLGRPFTRQGRTYRVCTKCGLSRDFNLTTWKTYGASYQSAPSTLSQ